MASVAKYDAHNTVNLLRHINREVAHSSNKDIQKEKSHLNYSMAPDRGMADYEYFKQRKGELYCYNRADVKVLCGWVCTAPKGLPPKLQERFFQETYTFLENRYGKSNVVQAVVHMDETQPHLHFTFIPATPDKNPRHKQAEKICANDVITRAELRSFHGDWQKHLNAQGIGCAVQSGVTAAQGGNRSVWEMKRAREYEHQHERKMVF